MNDDYITEAEAQSDNCWYEFDEEFVPYSDAEKRAYLAKKSRFNKADKGKFVIVQTPRRHKNLLSVLFLVDRSITKRFWWSHDARYAMKFVSKEAAEAAAAKYKYNHIRIRQI